MANTISPNMNLVIPGVGTEAGPTYASDINNSLTLIDSHSHSPGYGVAITPSGLNISSNLSMVGNSLINTGAITFQAVTVDPTSNSIYEKGVDLYYRDGSGNVIRITQSGSVSGSAGTITGLPSGTASATYSSGVFTFQSATATAANVDAGSYVLRNNTANSKGLTLQPPNAMTSDFTLTLPFIPAQTNLMTLDASGNMSSITYDTAVTSVSTAGANGLIGLSSNANIPGSSVTTGNLPIAVGPPNTPGGVGQLILAGTFGPSGSHIAGNGISVSSFASGVAVVSFDTVVFSAPPVVVVNGFQNLGFFGVSGTTNSGCIINTRDSSFTATNLGFSLIVVGPRV